MEDAQLQQAGRHPRMRVSAPPIPAEGDAEAWLTALRGSGSAHDEAVGSLYGLLARGARSEIARRWADIGYVDEDGIDDLATQAADDALVALLAKLDDFRGDSRFTTWACKFAILEAGTRARRRAWHHRDVILDSDSWKRLAEPAAALGGGREQLVLLGALADGIGVALTGHQRCVLVALAIDRVPIDVLAERLNTSRGALYETLHDARRRLRNVLTDRGLAVEPA